MTWEGGCDMDSSGLRKEGNVKADMRNLLSLPSVLTHLTPLLKYEVDKWMVTEEDWIICWTRNRFHIATNPVVNSTMSILQRFEVHRKGTVWMKKRFKAIFKLHFLKESAFPEAVATSGTSAWNLHIAKCKFICSIIHYWWTNVCKGLKNAIQWQAFFHCL